MSKGADEGASDHLWREIQKDFEALVRLIDRAIDSDFRNAENIERLERARSAAEKGAELARKSQKFRNP